VNAILPHSAVAKMVSSDAASAGSSDIAGLLLEFGERGFSARWEAEDEVWEIGFRADWSFCDIFVGELGFAAFICIFRACDRLFKVELIVSVARMIRS
jgi:hypothetical protein